MWGPLVISCLKVITPSKHIYRRKFRSQTSDNLDRWKSRGGNSQRGEEKKRQDQCVFPMICGSGGSKSRLAKAAGAEPFGHMRDEQLHAEMPRSAFRSQNAQSTPCLKHFFEVAMSKKCTPLWREAPAEVKMHKALHVRSTFGSCDVEKVHAVVARSTFPSQNVQSTPFSDDFWKLR